MEKEKELARKIQGWVPDNDLCSIHNKLRFIGISLSCRANADCLDPDELVGAGQTIFELSEELKTLDHEYTEFSLKLCELTAGRKFPAIQKSIARGGTQGGNTMYEGPKADRVNNIRWEEGDGLEYLVHWGIDPLKHYIDSLERELNAQACNGPETMFTVILNEMKSKVEDMEETLYRFGEEVRSF